MPLSPGTRLGSYEIVSLLGAGGMGEVYRARDPRLQREIALKVLPDVAAADADRRERFTDSRRIGSFAWSRDGKRLAIARLTVTNDIVLFQGLK